MKENVFSLFLKVGGDVVMLTVTFNNLRTVYMDSGN